MRASLERLYIGLSEVSIRLSRTTGTEGVKPDDKNKISTKKTEDVRVTIAKSLKKIHTQRAEYLQALKEKIQRGEYKVSAEEVAKALIGVIDDAP